MMPHRFNQTVNADACGHKLATQLILSYLTFAMAINDYYLVEKLFLERAAAYTSAPGHLRILYWVKLKHLNKNLSDVPRLQCIMKSEHRASTCPNRCIASCYRIISYHLASDSEIYWTHILALYQQRSRFT